MPLSHIKTEVRLSARTSTALLRSLENASVKSMFFSASALQRSRSGLLGQPIYISSASLRKLVLLFLAISAQGTGYSALSPSRLPRHDRTLSKSSNTSATCQTDLRLIRANDSRNDRENFRRSAWPDRGSSSFINGQALT